MNKLEIKAPAKINIGLKVTGKRSDGYHNIETVFYPVSLFDVITITHSDKFSFRCAGNIELNNSENSAVKAVRLLEEKYGQKFNISVELEKNIPVGAGMGGGSSDGAAVLLALNEFFKLELSSSQLSELALLLGSDVPFFIHPFPSFAASRGENLTPIKLDIPFPILIVNPGIHISTKWAYENIEFNSKSSGFFQILDKENIDFNSLKNIISNDFENVVFGKYEEIRGIKEELYECGASFSLMTGSGSTIFGIFKNMQDAVNASNKFPENYFTFIHYINDSNKS